MDEMSNLLVRRDIVRAYLLALDHTPELLAVCAASSGEEDARRRLRELFGISDVQANAILRLQVLRFMPDQIERVRSELDDITARLERLDR